MAFIERVNSICSSIHLASLNGCSRGLSSCGSGTSTDDMTSISVPMAEVEFNTGSGVALPARRLGRLGRPRFTGAWVAGGIAPRHARAQRSNSTENKGASLAAATDRTAAMG